MKLFKRVRSWLRAALRRAELEKEMDAELRFHVDAYADDLARGGMPPQEAMRRARLEFGGMERAKEECREARGVNLVDNLAQDLRCARPRGDGNSRCVRRWVRVADDWCGRRLRRAYCLAR